MFTEKEFGLFIGHSLELHHPQPRQKRIPGPDGLLHGRASSQQPRYDLTRRWGIFPRSTTVISGAVSLSVAHGREGKSFLGTPASSPQFPMLQKTVISFFLSFFFFFLE